MTGREKEVELLQIEVRAYC